VAYITLLMLSPSKTMHPGKDGGFQICLLWKYIFFDKLEVDMENKFEGSSSREGKRAIRTP